MKRSNHIFPNNTICWVYIYTDGKKAEGSFRIAYHLDLREEMKRLSGDAKLTIEFPVNSLQTVLENLTLTARGKRRR